MFTGVDINKNVVELNCLLIFIQTNIRGFVLYNAMFVTVFFIFVITYIVKYIHIRIYALANLEYHGLHVHTTLVYY